MINVRIRDGMCPDPTTGEGGATEGDIRGSFSDIIDVVGVKDLAGGHCLVTQNSPAAMSVLVAPGVVYIPNSDYDELDSNEPKFYEAIIDAEAEVAIGENTSGSTRIDLICVKIDKTITPDKHASNIATLVAVAGTPGAGTPATPDNHYVLATVAVANGASTILNANITSTRVQSKIDSDYIPLALPSGITLTSPKINENVALTSTSTELNNLHSKTLGLGNWGTWTPTFGNFTKGSATIVAKYIQIGKTIHYYLGVTLAADSSMGTNPYFSLPVASASILGSTIIGEVYVLDSGTAEFLGKVLILPTTTAEPVINNASGTYLTFTRFSSSVPMTWTTNDRLIITGTYEAA